MLRPADTELPAPFGPPRVRAPRVPPEPKRARVKMEVKEELEEEDKEARPMEFQVGSQCLG